VIQHRVFPITAADAARAVDEAKVEARRQAFRVRTLARVKQTEPDRWDVTLVVEPSRPLPGKLPRGRCPVCGADVALRKGGLVREHGRYDPVDPGILLQTVCDGAGQPAAS